MSEHVCRCNEGHETRPNTWRQTVPLHDGDKTCACDQGHLSYGACMRSKSIGFVGCFPTKSAGAGRGDAMAQKRQDKELNAYAAARKEGIQPAGTQMHQVEQAVRLSNDRGLAFDASAGGFVK